MKKQLDNNDETILLGLLVLARQYKTQMEYLELAIAKVINEEPKNGYCDWACEFVFSNDPPIQTLSRIKQILSEQGE